MRQGRTVAFMQGNSGNAARVRTLLMESGAELLATIPHTTGNESRSVIYVARKHRATSDQATRQLVS